jgi:two-component system KDP operon response regulator KdpE
VTAGGAAVELTRKEFELLALLARNPGKVLTHRTILVHVWGSAGTTETLRTHMACLRRKLGEGDDRPRLLSEPGVGYRIVLPAH